MAGVRLNLASNKISYPNRCPHELIQGIIQPKICSVIKVTLSINKIHEWWGGGGGNSSPVNMSRVVDIYKLMLAAQLSCTLINKSPPPATRRGHSCTSENIMHIWG